VPSLVITPCRPSVVPRAANNRVKMTQLFNAQGGIGLEIHKLKAWHDTCIFMISNKAGVWFGTQNIVRRRKNEY
jgi:hypothetical protein